MVGLGSCMGGISRFLISRLISISATTSFPWATLAVNLIGSLVIGIVYGFTAHRGSMPDTLRLLLTVGFCGGFTTFSTFSHESYIMMSGGHTAATIIYMASSLIGGMALVFLGYWIARQF